MDCERVEHGARSIDFDEPGMTGTTGAQDYQQVADALGYGADVMSELRLGAIEARWAPADEKAALHARFSPEIASLVS